MRKSAIIMVVVGLAILAGIYFYTTRKVTETVQNYPTPQVPQLPQATDIVVIYKKDGGFTPQSYQVKEGAKVVLHVTSDIADEVHLHGYDLSLDLEERKEGEIEFTADKTGRFEFELEESKITLGAIEVYPK